MRGRIVKIGNRSIGDGNPVFTIAEAGVNHNGDIEIAKRLIEEAKNLGADCVKFQTFKSGRVVSKNAPKAGYQIKTTDPSESQIDMLKKLELNDADFKELFDHCKRSDIMFLSTPYNVEDVDLLDDMGAQAFKLSSIHIAEPYFLEYVARKNKPILMSTGMATMEEIDEAVNVFKRSGNENFMLLQCTTNYPSKTEEANLKVISEFRRKFDIPIGYSDHTQDQTVCIAAVALGANIIEKHFTLDTSMAGPDHSSSADPDAFKKLVNNIRTAEKALGSDIKEPTEAEKINMRGMRRSITARCDIEAGTRISMDMLTFKRPATGISPKLLNEVLGRQTKNRVEEDSLIEWDDLV